VQIADRLKGLAVEGTDTRLAPLALRLRLARARSPQRLNDELLWELSTGLMDPWIREAGLTAAFRGPSWKSYTRRTSCR
jgi:hypothetical protein